ncbi:protein NODULATION SIGNALING PATHWAY 2-like [Impatiens glandulifera]|uniref:protein NODULATION SIGNALING PATHWAY 2-like n=1 Tax=Impatiens glandulifera TaxID=253017 RepID=UPI001FB15BF8|nr:protein NODULATION SIGNALING PATHWAY 2-like [Impatiens glandulifera]
MDCDHDIYYGYSGYNPIDKDQDFLSSDIDIDIDRILHSDEDSMHLDDFSRRISQDVELKADLNTHLQEIQDELMEESSLTDLLLAAAEAVQAKNPAMALALVERLNSSDLFIGKNEIFENGDSFNRLAFFFTQAIHSISTTCINHDSGVQNRGINLITAFQMLQELSPYVKFAHFTANQAILEATERIRSIHVVDFDIMEGIQWPPLMADLAARKGIATFLRITAVSRKGQILQQTGRRLKEFADSIGLDFAFDQIAIEEEDEFERIRSHGYEDRDRVFIANCMINQFYMPQRSMSEIKTFLRGVQRLDPKIIVLVEEELFKGVQSMSFVEFFCEALHHYNALSDSLIGGLCGGYKIALRLIEKEFIRVRISESLRNFQSYEDGFLPLKGLRSIPMSYSNVSQARFLVSLFSGGYWLQHEKGSLSLCWKSKPLTTATILVPIKTKSCP